MRVSIHLCVLKGASVRWHTCLQSTRVLHGVAQHFEHELNIPRVGACVGIAHHGQHLSAATPRCHGIASAARRRKENSVFGGEGLPGNCACLPQLTAVSW